MKDRRSWRLIAALLMVGALLLAACSSDSDEGAPPDGTDTASDVDANGVLQLGYDINQSGNAWNYNALKIAQGNSASNDPLWYFQYGRLMRPKADGSIEPDLATSVEIVDTKTIKVVLRDGLKFSDDSALDADAVKASYEAILAARADNEDGFQPAFYSLDSIEVTSPTTLTLGFSDGTAPSWYDRYVSTFAGSVFKFGGDPNVPIGAGPFKVTAYSSGSILDLRQEPELLERRRDPVRRHRDPTGQLRPAGGRAGGAAVGPDRHHVQRAAAAQHVHWQAGTGPEDVAEQLGDDDVLQVVWTPL